MPFWRIGLVPIGRISDTVDIPSQGILSERLKRNFHTILMARLTRIAVNLTLIVTIAIQPSMVFALRKACAARCASQFTCQGCGGCQVDTSGDRCGCCGGNTDVNSDDESASCCGHSSVRDDSPFVETEIANGPVDEQAPSCYTAEDLGTSSKSTAVETGCHCLHAPETPCAPVPRSPAGEVRDLVSLGLPFSVNAVPREQRLCVRAFGDVLSLAILHFAQIELCVWRL